MLPTPPRSRFFLKLFMYSQVHATVTVETDSVLMSLSSERYTTFFASHVYTEWNMVYELIVKIKTATTTSRIQSDILCW